MESHELLADENFPEPACRRLRRLGHSVTSATSIRDTPEAPLSDESILAHANKHRMAVLTHNRKHFVALHDSGQPHHGVIACTVDSDFERLADQIHSAICEKKHLTRTLIQITKDVKPRKPK